MKRIYLIALFFMIAMIGKAQTAQEIITSYYQAIGGKKWDAVTNMKMNAVVDNNGMKIPVEVVITSKGKTYTKITIQGTDIIQSAFDGTTSWGVNFMTQKAEKSSSDDSENAKRSAIDFPNALIVANKLDYKVTLDGEEKIDGTTCFKLKVEKKTMLADGKEVPNIEYYYIDKDNNILIMTETEITSGQMKGKIAQTKYSNYQEVNGVYIAFSQSSGVKDEGEMAISFDKIEVNVSVDDTVFVYKGE